MSDKILIIFKDDQRQEFPIQQEKIVIGRDRGCDVVLDDEAVSRKHAALVHKFGAVYIENISSTGKVLKGNDSVEYVQVDENEEISIGPFVLCWELKSKRPAVAPAQSVDDADAEAPTYASPDNPGADPIEIGDMPLIGGAVDVVPDPENSINLGSIDLNLDNQVENENAPSPDFEVISTNSSTAVGKGSVHGMLKVMKGEVNGREIKLDYGVVWIVGRSPKSHIHIDSPKLSRQHFKIVKIGQGYRVQDLDSANGTRVNGVAISDAPLQPFDTIAAGPVELQFMIVDSSKLSAAPAQQLIETHLPVNNGVIDTDYDSASPNEKTAFAPPAPYVPQNNAFTGPGGFQSPPQSTFSATTPKKQKSGSIVAWIHEQPAQRKALYGVALLLLIGFGLFEHLNPTPSTAPVMAENTTDNARQPAAVIPQLAEPNAADPREISPEFAALPAEKKAEIAELYAKAERAQASKDWKTAFDSSRAILNVIKRYKNAADIMDVAQTYLNEDQIGMISKSLTNVQDAAADNQERVALYLENGDKALKDKRWDDARESFTKALNLDPNSDRALQGFAKAEAKDANMRIDVPKEAPVNTEEMQAVQRERDELDGLSTQYQEARSRVYNGNFREALPVLKDLDKKIQDRLDEYNSGGRAPASIREEFTRETKALGSKVREAIDISKSQLKQEYATQLADAEQFINNRQYAEAREIYDRILRVEPAFDDVSDAREKLYSKLITEAKTIYQEGLIYESVGDLDNAVDGFKKTKVLLTNVRHSMAVEYYKKASFKLRRLQR